MANVQVMRFETKAKLGAQAQLVNHVNGTTRPETSRDPGVVSVHGDVELGAVVHLAGEGMGAAREALDAALASRSGKGRPPKQCVDFLFAGPPPCAELGAWSPDRELAWYDATRDALRELVGERSVIVTCDAHRDETSPHVQALVVPIDSTGRLGWCHVRDEAAKRLRPEVAKMRAEAEQRIAQRRAAGEDVPDLPPPSTKSRYGVLQDWLYYRVSRSHGLDRGVPGSEAKHEEIDRSKAAEARELRARSSAEALERDAEQYRDAAGDGSDRVVQLEERERDLRREINILEADREQARERRDEEARALVAARELREREEAIAGGTFTGRRGRKGRTLIADFEQRIATAESERDANRAAVGERDELRSTLAERTRERDTQCKRAETAESKVEELERDVDDVKASGIALGLRTAGDLLGRLLARAVAPLSRVPGLDRFVDALNRGDARGATQALHDTIPAQRPAQPPRRGQTMDSRALDASRSARQPRPESDHDR